MGNAGPQTFSGSKDTDLADTKNKYELDVHQSTHTYILFFFEKLIRGEKKNQNAHPSKQIYEKTQTEVDGRIQHKGTVKGDSQLTHLLSSPSQGALLRLNV